MYNRWGERGSKIYYRTADENATSWSEERLLADADFNLVNPAVVGTPSGRVIAAWEAHTPERRIIRYSYTDDYGMTWQGPFTPFDTEMVVEARDPDLAVTPAGDVWLTYNAAVRDSNNNWQDGLYYQKSSDNGGTWTPPARIQDAHCCQSIAGTPSGLVLAWSQGDWVGHPLNFHNEDVYYRTSVDEGASWSAAVRYTSYAGRDASPNVAGLAAGGFALIWEANRKHSSVEYTQDQAIWFGNPAVHQDVDYPPHIARLDHFPIPQPQSGDEAFVFTTVVGDLGTVDVEWSIDGVPQPDVLMAQVTTGRYRASLGVMDEAGVNVRYKVRAEDVQNNVMRSHERDFDVVLPPEVRHDVLLVVDERNHEHARHIGAYYRRALDDARVKYDFWDTSRLGPPFEDDLEPYLNGAVVWAAPQESWLREYPIRNRVPDAIAAFRSRGGSLFVTGQDISEHFRHDNPEWLADTLHAAHARGGATNDVEAIPGRLFPRGLSLSLEGGDGANNSWSPDAIRPVGGAQTVLRYLYRGWVPALGPEGDAQPEDAEVEPQGHEFNSEIAAIRHRDGQSRLVFFAFNFESISSPATRGTVMRRVMRYLNPTCAGHASTIDGTMGPDVITGTPGRDVIMGFGGDDQIFALGDRDIVCSGGGDDIVDGGSGNDRIFGGPGDDTLMGRLGRDAIHGGPGHDVVRGDHGDDILWGDNGNDRVIGGPDNDRVIGGRGNDVLQGNLGNDLLLGDPGGDSLFCGAGTDIARGGLGTDTAHLNCEVQTGIP